MTLRRAWLWSGTSLLSLLCSCSSSSSGSGQQTCSDVSVKRFQELIVVDPAVVGDARAMNGSDGAWSFRHAVENMMPAGSDASAFVQAWLNEWVTDSSFNGYSIPDAPQVGAGGSQPLMAQGMNKYVLCPWMSATPSNGCNSDCSACSANPPTLDLAKAPFRLIAIVNRMDLHGLPDVSVLGEARLVFGLTDGPADDASSHPLSMTVIFEYGLPPPMTLAQWAQAWHSLGAFASFDESYKAALQKVTDKFVLRNAHPGLPDGSALSQVRTNENVLFWAWQMRQFALGSDGHLHAHGLRNTPDPSLNGSTELAQFIQNNAAAIQDGTHLLPNSMLSATADELLYSWGFSDVDPGLQAAFAKGTCNGCHAQGLNPSVDAAFHVSPLRVGVSKLSPFLNDPADPTHDDLARRTTLLQSALCGN